MSSSFLTFLGLLSAAIFLVGNIPYVRDTLKGKTKPHRVTWGVVCLLNIVGFASQLASGASNSLWIFGTAIVTTATIFLLSIRRGTGGHSRLDIAALVASLLGVGLWLISGSPTVSIVVNILVIIMSLTPTFIKARQHPESETRVTWLCGTIGTALSAVSVGSLDVTLLLLPITGTLVQGYMVYLLYVRPKRQAAEPPVTAEDLLIP